MVTEANSFMNTELSVWENKLVWVVKIDGIKLGNERYGFDLKVDTQTSEILFDDFYCAIE